MTTLYRSTDCLCRRGAAVKNLAQSASLHVGENNAPSKPGTKHLGHNPQGDRHFIGRRISYCDLSLFQLVAGLRYAFPQAMARLEPSFARITALHARVAARPRIAAYLKSPRRIPFNEQGIFRHYPELDATN